MSLSGDETSPSPFRLGKTFRPVSKGLPERKRATVCPIICGDCDLGKCAMPFNLNAVIFGILLY